MLLSLSLKQLQAIYRPLEATGFLVSQKIGEELNEEERMLLYGSGTLYDKEINGKG